MFYFLKMILFEIMYKTTKKEPWTPTWEMMHRDEIEKDQV